MRLRSVPELVPYPYISIRPAAKFNTKLTNSDQLSPGVCSIVHNYVNTLFTWLTSPP